MDVVQYANKLFNDVQADLGLLEEQRQLFVSAFASGYLFNEYKKLEDSYVEMFEDQLDLPLH